VLIPKRLLRGAKIVEIRKEQGGILLLPLPTDKEDPIRRLGKHPVSCGLTNGSEAHDEHLYGNP
jgi:hypothetical protein